MSTFVGFLPAFGLGGSTHCFEVIIHGRDCDSRSVIDVVELEAESCFAPTVDADEAMPIPDDGLGNTCTGLGAILGAGAIGARCGRSLVCLTP